MKSGIKDGTEVTRNLSSNVSGDSNDDTSFPHILTQVTKYKFTNTQVLIFCKVF